jgi:hypothetical protein
MIDNSSCSLGSGQLGVMVACFMYMMAYFMSMGACGPLGHASLAQPQQGAELIKAVTKVKRGRQVTFDQWEEAVVYHQLADQLDFCEPSSQAESGGHAHARARLCKQAHHRSGLLRMK